MNRFTLVAALFLASCAPGPDAPKPKPVVISSGVWDALADRVEKGKVADTDEILRIVRELKASGDVSDTAAFDAEFPELKKANRVLTKEAIVETQIVKRLRAFRR